jgi:hypothetical protein
VFAGNRRVENNLAKPASKTKSIYGVHPGVLMIGKWIADLKQKTGRSLDEWMKFIKQEGPLTESARRDWLKHEQVLGTNYASWLAAQSVGKNDETSDPAAYLRAAERYVDQMFAGKKEHLRPIYEALLKLGLSMGRDTKACPCQTIVPLYRHHVFAQIKPTTQTRIDLGLALGDTKKTPKRLIGTGGFAKKDRITHRFEITSPKDIDDEVKRWTKVAYDRDE